MLRRLKNYYIGFVVATAAIILSFIFMCGTGKYFGAIIGILLGIPKRASPATQLGSAKRGSPRLTNARRSRRAIRAAISNFRLKQLAFYCSSWAESNKISNWQ